MNRSPARVEAGVVAKVMFWSSLGALAWTQVGYPLAVAAVARLRERPVRKRPAEPTVALIVAAHDEEHLIERRLDNLLRLDYPSDKLQIVVTSDASADRTDELVEAVAAHDNRVSVLRCPREGKVAAQNRAVASTQSEIIAFTDANARWRPDALSKLVRNFADPDVAYVCGSLQYETTEGTNRESVYWRYESWLRSNESRLGSITGGIGGIYAVRRADYVANEPRFGHDLGFPYLMAQRGRRAVYDPAAVATEKPARDVEDEYRRKVRMLSQCWLHVLTGRMFRGGGPLYLAQIVSHRLLRYGSGILHLVLVASSVVLVGDGIVYSLALAAQIAGLALAAAGRLRLPVPGASLAYYYLSITVATLTGLVRYLRFGVPVMWEKVEGTR